MSRVERLHSRMIFEILQSTLAGGVNADYYDTFEKYYGFSQATKLRIAHYPLYDQLSYPKCFAPEPSAVLESPQGGRIRTQRMTFNIFDTLYESYTNDWCRLNVKDLEYHNRIYIGVYE